ncbi:MAG: tRNA preQ1(34) S-adenosylmethionine ribosyltransferase-isomerase QueA [Anaerolineales bacterium]
MKTSDFDYVLSPEHIAQEPVEPRDAARLLVLDRRTGSRLHRAFHNLPELLYPGDLLVANHSRVILARLAARKLPGGGKVELLLLEKLAELSWTALVGGRGLDAGKQVKLQNGVVATIESDLGGAQRLLAFNRPIEAELGLMGAVPLPPYIHTRLADPERYQTVYACEPGSAAAPTAGLHFTPRLIAELKAKGVRFAKLTLHIGLDTFTPVTEEDALQHNIHTEWCQLPKEVADLVNETHAKGGRVIAVGTTSVRTLESAAAGEPEGFVRPFEGRTGLFILPGYNFRVVDAMLTNFHLPRSTLLMLVSAFAGRELVLDTYRAAIAERYRFYSFGDAMFIV